jgi:hypothetical protein
MVEKASEPKTKKKKYEDWEVRSALDDLERAERVKENPELMKLVEKQAKKKIADLKRIKWTK